MHYEKNNFLEKYKNIDKKIVDPDEKVLIVICEAHP